MGAIFAPLILLMAWRFWLVGVYVDADGIKVVGFLRSRRFPWTDIEGFAVEPLSQYPYVGWVVLHNGRHIPMLMAISAAGWPTTEGRRLQAQRPVDELNRALGNWQAGRDSLPP